MTVLFYFQNILTILFHVAVLVRLGKSQVATAGPCPAAQCSCSEHIVDCQLKNLSDIPVFQPDNVYYTLQLDHNHIDNVPNLTFRYLHGVREIHIENNNISQVEYLAFQGLEKQVYTLDLSHNQLTSFPTAIGNLENINHIDVQDNPIDADSFDEHTMYLIGDTVTNFEFGSDTLTAWPSTLRHLQDLGVLTVNGGSFYTLPPDAFHGFEGTLRTLTIKNTKLIALPLALANLRFLDTFHFDHNHDIGDSGVLLPSFGNTELLTRLTEISLVDDNLTIFPSLLKYLRSVTRLFLDSNKLKFVSDTSIRDAVGTQVDMLSLRNCSLTRVPGALSKLTTLRTLDLADNQIRSFENSDFEGMMHLQNLTIKNNPLEYIANETFIDLVCLQTLDIMESNIQSIPEAIRFLSSLSTLKLPTDKIECTCNIVWMKQFMESCNKNLTIAGSCETIDSNVDDYLKVHIPNCPNFVNATGCINTALTC